MVGKAQKSHGARSGLYGGCSNVVSPLWVSASIANFQSRNADAPLKLLRHPKKFSFKTTVTPFSRSGWSVVRSASLAKGGTWKTRPSPHLHKVPIRSNEFTNFSNGLRISTYFNHLVVRQETGKQTFLSRITASIEIATLHSGRNWEQTKFGESLLQFTVQSFSLPHPIYKPKHQNIQNRSHSLLLHGLKTEYHPKVRTLDLGCSKKISGPKREELTQRKRTLHSDEFHYLHSSPNISGSYEIKEREMGGNMQHAWKYENS
jgi:hypothetical protein